MVARVSPNFRRYLPLILFAAILLFIVPNVLRKKSSGPSAGTRAGQTIEVMNLIDKGEQGYMKGHGRYTSHLADLLTPRMANDLAIGLGAQVDAGSDGQRFLARVEGDVLSLVRGRNGATLSAQSCLVLKSGSGVACPASKK